MTLPHHSTAVREFTDITGADRAWICLTPNACHTWKPFLIWMVYFCHWLTRHRASSQMAESRPSDCLLIVEGHTSRAHPLALEIFRRFAVQVFTLPSHTPHICQFFDVGLASSLQHAIKDHLQRLGRTLNHENFPNERVKVRWPVVNAFIDAWCQVLTPT
jgi:hypothetical protein